MSSGSETELELEIAHVLLIDVVGYSKLLVNTQIDILQELNVVVRNTAHFRAAEAKGKLGRLPTGDGMALIFFDSPEAPVQCALEISRALKDERRFLLRMGAHSGPIKEIKDVNDRSNFAGAGINVAQRVLDCGDAGHILLSERLADDLRSYKHWHPYLFDLGKCEVKHGLQLHLFNLCKEGLGNAAVPEKIQGQQGRWQKWRRFTAPWLTGSRKKITLGLTVGALIIALALGFVWSQSSRAKDPFASIPIKSIAVLPFGSLSAEKENFFFASGVQDEILTALAKLSDLKVISRTSVLQYAAGTPRNVREIALALGVVYILEGDVQRADGRVRVHAQLIDARTDAHLWAKRFDRELTNVFEIQTQIAEQIAAQLETRLSPQEQAAIKDQATTDLEAHDLFVSAKGLIDAVAFSAKKKEDLTEAVRFLLEAVTRDPGFALAYYWLANAQDQLYSRFDPSPGRMALAESALQKLQRLRPDAAETHLALASHFYWANRDYESARQELTIAGPGLPNDPLVPLLSGFIDRRQGRWANSITNLKRALELDPKNPQNPFTLHQIALSYFNLRKFPEMVAALDQAIALAPNDLSLRAERAAVDLEWRGDTKPLHDFIQVSIATSPNAEDNLAEWRFYLGMIERDRIALSGALALLGPQDCRNEDIPFPRSWCEGLAAQVMGDERQARAAFEKTRQEAERLVNEQPLDPGATCVLAMANAALGRKEEAIRDGRRAVDLLPIRKDAINGNLLVENLAIVYAWTGEKDLATRQLKVVADGPSYLSYGNLKLHPQWDALRGDPGFEEIVRSLAPKEAERP